VGAADRATFEKQAELPGYRTIFVFVDVEGYEHTEIADLMGSQATPVTPIRQD
jgi:DNA-directed RNA polymerase specialized sigma24 family protein